MTSAAPGPSPEDVDFLFRRVLGRPASSAELATRVGQPLQTLVADLRSTEEVDARTPAPGDVRLLFEALLERVPRPDEIAEVLDADLSLVEVLRMIDRSEERAALLAARARARTAPRRANVWTAGTAPWTHPPGTASADGAVIVGHDGHLFLRTGTNAVLDQVLGRAELPPRWQEDWERLVAQRTASAAGLGVRLAMLVVPDKLAVLPELFPEPLVPAGPRPLQRLLDAGLPLLCPAPEEAREHYLRTDTHLTLRGNLHLHDLTCRALGVEAPDPLADVELEAYFSSGDLGTRFAPEVCEVMHKAVASPAVLEQSNREALAAAGRFVGTRCTWRHPAPARPETVVVLGDSYAYGEPGYLGLAWLLAQSFACVHFTWAPFGWDPDLVRRTEARLVVTQTAERFVRRVPAPAIDVEALEGPPG